jgi:hypothetical protein
MDFTKLQTLKDMVMTATELGKPWDYFFDHFGADREFIALGKRVKKAPLLTGILEMVGGQILGEKAGVTELKLTSLRKRDFVHGACYINGRLVAVLYFTDVKMGMLSISDPTARPYNTFFARFTNFGVVPDDGTEPILAPIPPTRGVVN